MKRHEVFNWIGTILGLGAFLVYMSYWDTPPPITVGFVLMALMMTGAGLGIYGQSLDPDLKFLYGGSFRRTVGIFLAVSGVGWLLTAAVRWVYNLVAG